MATSDVILGFRLSASCAPTAAGPRRLTVLQVISRFASLCWFQAARRRARCVTSGMVLRPAVVVGAVTVTAGGVTVTVVVDGVGAAVAKLVVLVAASR